MTEELSASITDDKVSQIELHSGKYWILRIRENGIVFNHEEWPDATPSDFAQAFCDVLEKGYDVSFIKRTTT